VINKDLVNATPVSLNLSNLPAAGTARMWQLTSASGIHPLPDATFTNALLNQTVPPQSITLFVLPSVTSFSLRPSVEPPAGQMKFWLDGQAGRTYILQSSPDLIQWSGISTNTLGSNSMSFHLSATNSTQMFYRGVLAQP
jgi:hypothetical protein